MKKIATCCFVIILFSTFLASSLPAQKARLDKANKAVEYLNYSDTIQLYQEVL